MKIILVRYISPELFLSMIGKLVKRQTTILFFLILIPFNNIFSQDFLTACDDYNIQFFKGGTYRYAIIECVINSTGKCQVNLEDSLGEIIHSMPTIITEFRKPRIAKLSPLASDTFTIFNVKNLLFISYYDNENCIPVKAKLTDFKWMDNQKYKVRLRWTSLNLFEIIIDIIEVRYENETLR